MEKGEISEKRGWMRERERRIFDLVFYPVRIKIAPSFYSFPPDLARSPTTRYVSVNDVKSRIHLGNNYRNEKSTAS